MLTNLTTLPRARKSNVFEPNLNVWAALSLQYHNPDNKHNVAPFTSDFMLQPAQASIILP